MAKKNINIIDRSKIKSASVSEKKEDIEKRYQNAKLKVDNKNPDNKDLRNTGQHIKEEIQKNEKNAENTKGNRHQREMDEFLIKTRNKILD